ncbi:DNA polymerase beta superfamily protein [Aureivirga marina]|uniref:DNA polymerase beta superfamily protein n=1 Tax=Aureivirga marina TaxID=1182451 RepID=UPI0018C90B1C|nr:nucleotidyltransferase domain-containing protein [Aureivirga marina]
MTIKELREKGWIILECISGSKAYGLNTPTSDTDIKGVFLLPKEEFYGLNYIPQIANETNDIVFYEFNRFMELLSVNNPNILELLNTPSESTIYKSPVFDKLKSEYFLSKICSKTFGKFALSQIKKAKGLKKKIVNPVAKERKSILHFCFINHEQGSISLLKYLEIKNWKQENCGLVNIPHMQNIFGLYYSDEKIYKGIMKSEIANEISLSSIPKNAKQEALFYFNKDGYSSYCREYREYWDWVEKRNESRYENTQHHGKNYDAKNMMHVFRLLEMAIEIAKEKKVNVKRPNRDFLLKIKSGEFDYDYLLNLANEKQKELEIAFETSNLPEKPNFEKINRLTFEIRKKLYEKRI